MGGCYEIDGVRPVVDPRAFVHPDAVLIGDVVVDAACYIGPLVSLRGDLGRIHVGAGANLQDSVVVHCFPGRSTLIAEDGHIGHAAVIHGAHIGRGALVGIGAVVMDGATVGDFAFVGAHSLVPTGLELRPGWLYVGSPARPVRVLSEDEKAWKANGTRIYQGIARRCLATMRRVDPLRELDDDRPTLDIAAAAARPLKELREALGTS